MVVAVDDLVFHSTHPAYHECNNHKVGAVITDLIQQEFYKGSLQCTTREHVCNVNAIDHKTVFRRALI